MTMGRPLGSRNSAPRPDMLRIVRTAKTHPAPTPQPTPCVLWQGSTFKANGYGRKWDPVRQRSILAHRWAWEYLHGPTDLDVLHKCDNPPCFRIDHLFVGTAVDNALDMMAKGRGRGQFKPTSKGDIHEQPNQR